MLLSWSNASFDRFMTDAMSRSAASSVKAGIWDRQDLNNASTYTYFNYALLNDRLERR